ncbi:MAG TPA: hypothetical protein VIJ88_01875, partial [Candidatus Paceibacterota bacterium]
RAVSGTQVVTEHINPSATGITLANGGNGDSSLPVVPQLITATSNPSYDSASSLTINQGQSVTLSWDLQPSLQTVMRTYDSHNDTGTFWTASPLFDGHNGNVTHNDEAFIASPPVFGAYIIYAVGYPGTTPAGQTYFTMSGATTGGNGFTSAPSTIGSVTVTPSANTTYTLSVPITYYVDNATAENNYVNSLPNGFSATEIYDQTCTGGGDSGVSCGGNLETPFPPYYDQNCNYPGDGDGSGSFNVTCNYNSAEDPNYPPNPGPRSRTITFSIPVTVAGPTCPDNGGVGSWAANSNVITAGGQGSISSPWGRVCIANYTNNIYFVPVKTQAEWNSFLAATAGLSVGYFSY